MTSIQTYEHQEHIILNSFNKCMGILVQGKYQKLWWPSLPVTFTKCDILLFTKFGKKVGNQNKPAPHIEVPLH